MTKNPTISAVRSLAGKKGVAAKRKKKLDAMPKMPVAMCDALPLDPMADDAIEAYDARLGFPGTWSDAKTRAQLIGALIANEEARESLAQRRGRSFTRQQVEQREEHHAVLYQSALNDLAGFLANHVPADKINSIRTEAAKWINDRRRTIRAAIVGGE